MSAMYVSADHGCVETLHVFMLQLQVQFSRSCCGFTFKVEFRISCDVVLCTVRSHSAFCFLRH